MTLRLFVENKLTSSVQVILNESQSHYLAHVMRVRLNDEVLLFNGTDGEWKSKVAGISKKSVVLDVIEQTRKQDKDSDVWLCFAPVKKDNTDLIVQKATELGVARLCPVITKRTITNKVNTDRMHLLAIEASEQSERLSVPKISDPQKLDVLLKNWDDTRTLYYLSERQDTKVVNEFSRKAAFLVGPEGGFDEDEIKKLSAFSCATPVHLGRRILRAETACVASLVIWNQSQGWT